MLCPVLAYLGVSWATAASVQIALVLNIFATTLFLGLSVFTIRKANRAVLSEFASGFFSLAERKLRILPAFAAVDRIVRLLAL